MRRAVEVKPVILQRLVRLRNMEPNVSVAFVAYPIPSNHSRGE